MYRVISENKSEKCNSLRKLQKTSAQLKGLLHSHSGDAQPRPDLHNAELMSRDHKMQQQKFLHFIIFICLNALNAYCSSSVYLISALLHNLGNPLHYY